MRDSQVTGSIMLLAATWGTASGFGTVQRKVVDVDGISRTYWQQDPSGTPPSAGWPVVLSFHGWCGTATAQAASDSLRVKGAKSAIVIHPEGYSDPTDPGSYGPAGWQSFNGGGSAGAQAGGMDGPICQPDSVSSSGWQCYKSCKALGYCTDKCRWSHCLSDARFVHEILRTIPARDVNRTFATGHSNGAMLMYELARDPASAPLLAAVAPVSGIPHNGFNVGSLSTDMRYLEVQGSHDSYVVPYSVRWAFKPRRIPRSPSPPSSLLAA
jgi:poly(3-hydroxybutyrate) depolymerase